MAENGARNEIVPCSIKCAARKAMKESPWKEQILAKFKEKSIICTRIARLASLFMHVSFNRKMDNNELDFFNVVDDYRRKNSPTEQVTNKYFYAVLNQNFNKINGLVREDYDSLNVHMKAVSFNELMTRFDVEVPNNRYMDNIFKNLYQQYHVNFRNNIVMHAKSRIIRFMRWAMNTIRPVPDDISATAKKQHRKENNTAIYHTVECLFEKKATLLSSIDR